MPTIRSLPLLLALLLPWTVSQAEVPWQFGNNTRYLALGDSLSAGYGAMPTTQGFTYLLYQGGVFDTLTNTLFANAAVPGASSLHVLEYQVPQALQAFYPHVITLTVGGNDLLRILGGAEPLQVLAEFELNLRVILHQLRSGLPEARIIVSNLYSIPEIPGADQVVPQFNQIVAQVAAEFSVAVADIYSAFQGRKGLLLIYRHGAAQYEVHPSNAGHRVMAQAFEAAADKHFD